MTIAPDVTLDATTGWSYYMVELSMENLGSGALDDIDLVPGMPVQANIQTGTRSVNEISSIALSPISSALLSRKH